ncbi:MAG: hypothetical protein KH369_13925 [Paraclostridium bifermentans]|uniref:hypothetical protein n=1 Tax=Paraclostridium bifermentans TaxID=1490 RepID=UPI0011DCF7D7|nr:hypothetical protein [Paraclostridium bifermentans]MBS6509294.1 hypothetical protein [Paraclostridium bifermentans]MDU3803498.1 hypothetical protein [Paraclostridium bifermentans]
MQNKFVPRILFSITLIIIGIIEMIFNSSEGFDFGYLNISIGGMFLIISMISYIKYQNNKKEIDRELSKEYDERDDLIDGKVAKFTLSALIYVIFIIMFLANWIMIETNVALSTILIFFMIIEFLSRKYYNKAI